MNDKLDSDDQTKSPLDEFRNLLQAVATGMGAFRERATEIAAIVGPILAEISANVRELPDRTITLQRNLAKRGWYAMPEMPLPDLFALEDTFAEDRRRWY